MAIGRLHHVVLDTPDPGGLASFWSEVLGHPPTWPDPARPMQIHLHGMGAGDRGPRGPFDGARTTLSG